MKITIVGAGYVGLVTGACFADFGILVDCIDNEKDKIKTLNNGQIPFFEPDLKELIEKNKKAKRLKFTSNLKESVKDSQVIFIAVGTPPKEDGSADLAYVKAVINEIGQSIDSYKVIVTKSTVPVGTGKKIKSWLKEIIQDESLFDIVSNPEFLREGAAIEEFTNPNRIVIGSESQKAIDIVKTLYKPLEEKGVPFVITNLETSELIKYASNSFLAIKISFINEIALLCDKIGANVQTIAKGIGLDERIGKKFLNAGVGFGGSCFPKDTKALQQIGLDHNIELKSVKAAIEINKRQVEVITKQILEKVKKKKEDISIAILGLSFKPNTDDIREAPALYIIEKFLENNIKVCATDPEAILNTKIYFEKNKNFQNLIFYKDIYECVKSASAVVLVTEWQIYKNLDLKLILDSLKEPVFFDLRNIYNPSDMRKKGFDYYSIGR